MIKQLVAFALAAAFSMSASAGYIQYNLSNVMMSDGSSLEGWFVQDSGDGAIAYYEFRSGGPASDYMAPWGSEYYSKIELAYSYFDGFAGPTSFSFSDNMSTSYHHFINFTFRPGSRGIQMSGSDSAIPAPETIGWPGFPPVFRQIVSGTVVEGEIDPMLLASLEAGNTYLNRVEPRVVPEPGTLALLVAGACAAAGRRRRLKQDVRT